MKSLTVKGGRLLSPANGLHGDPGDVVIRNGRIARVGCDLDEEGLVVDATGMLVTPGLIDIHTHCYPAGGVAMRPDEVGVDRGVTAVIDAGTSGANNFEHFLNVWMRRSRTKVYALLNIYNDGLTRAYDPDDRSRVDEEAALEMCRRHPDRIVGIKALASASAVGNLGIEPIAAAARVAHELHKPLVVHIGNQPPAFPEVLGLLKAGDVVTHTFHGKPGGLIGTNGAIIPEALAARERGVLFDVGHGADSFNVETWRKAVALGFGCDLISTDLHRRNCDGPVFSLPAVMSKMASLGVPVEDVVAKVTCAPVRAFGLAGAGELAPGAPGDVSIIACRESGREVVDSDRNAFRLTCELKVETTIYSWGDESDVIAGTPGED